MGKFLLLLAMPILIGSGFFLSFNSEIITAKNELISPEKSNVEITYSIDNNTSNSDSKYSERGVYYDTLNQPNAPHYYTIAMGEKNTGGYSINIENVNIDTEGNVEVIVEETNPDADSIVTMAFTYPTCMVTLDKLPSSITVKNTEGKIFKNINF